MSIIQKRIHITWTLLIEANMQKRQVFCSRARHQCKRTHEYLYLLLLPKKVSVGFIDENTYTHGGLRSLYFANIAQIVT